MNTSTVIIKVDDELKMAFATAAKADDRTTSQLIREYMREFVNQKQHEDFLHKKVIAGRKSFEQGQFHSNDEVEAIFKKRRAASLKANK